MSPWPGSVMALFVRPGLLLHPSVALRDDAGSATDGLLLVGPGLMPHSGTQTVEAIPARPRGSTAPRGAAAAPREHPADFLPVPLAWSARQGHSVEGMPGITRVSPVPRNAAQLLYRLPAKHEISGSQTTDTPGTSPMQQRRLRQNLEVSTLGLGCTGMSFFYGQPPRPRQSRD